MLNFYNRNKLLKSQDFMKQVESDVQASKGQLQLPQRDIPRENTHITQDNHVKPITFQKDQMIILKSIKQTKLFKRSIKRRRKVKNIDFLYENSNTIIITLLYFLFQLPVVKKL